MCGEKRKEEVDCKFGLSGCKFYYPSFSLLIIKNALLLYPAKIEI
jgi:hypothetical protein